MILGLAQVKNKLIKNLSRGYKQRVSLAGALIGDPEVLILDEPTVGLDPKQITEIRDLIKNLGKNHTVILSTHILSEVSQICKKVIIIDKGKIVAIDTPENLEKTVENDSTITVIVEDKKESMQEVISKIKDIRKSELISENEDGTKTYKILSKENKDIRKVVFETFAKNNITIFELKKSENTLEDAFIKLIETSKDSETLPQEERKKKGGKK